MKKVFKWTIVIIGCLILFGLWYNWKYSMGIANQYTVNSHSSADRLLIVTQQSEYKDKLTTSITDHFRGSKLYITVIDVNELKPSLSEGYDAIVIIHTYQMWEPPEKVSAFINQATEKNKIFAVCTSGPGDVLTEGVDGISSASVILDVESDALKTIDWINDQFRID